MVISNSHRFASPSALRAAPSGPGYTKRRLFETRALRSRKRTKQRSLDSILFSPISGLKMGVRAGVDWYAMSLLGLCFELVNVIHSAKNTGFSKVCHK